MKKRAVTILEILVGLSLLSLVLTFVLNLVPGSLLGLKNAEKRSAARQLAREKLAEEMLKPYPQSESQQELPAVTLEDTEYRILRIVETGASNSQIDMGAAGTGQPSTRIIRIRVSWPEPGRTAQLEQETIRSEAGD